MKQNGKVSPRSALRTHAGKLRLLQLEDLDARTYAARNAKQLISALECDLGGDVSTAQKELIQRAALLGAICGDIESCWLSGSPADLSLLGTLVDRQRRLLETLGIKRQARDCTPNLHEYINGAAE